MTNNQRKPKIFLLALSEICPTDADNRNCGFGFPPVRSNATFFLVYDGNILDIPSLLILPTFSSRFVLFLTISFKHAIENIFL